LWRDGSRRSLRYAVMGKATLSRPLPILLLFLGGVEAAALILLASWPGTAMPWPGTAFFVVAFGAYAAASFRSSDASTHPSPAVVWGVAVLLRLALLPVAPELSDDVFRYLWDGHVQLQGINPYRYAPADPALTGIRTPWHDLINNPEISTIYAPAAQFAFLIIALAGGGILQAKLLWIGLDLLTSWVLFRVAKKTGRNAMRVLVLYLWCPLLVVETAWSAHLEPLGLLALALAVLLALQERPTRTGIATAAAALTKFAPVAALPPLLRRQGPRRGLRFGMAFVVTVLLAYLPYLDAGPRLWSGLFTYVRDWRFMVGPFAVLETVFPGRWPPRLAAGVIVGGVVTWATWRRFSVERSLFWILGAGLLLSPTIHPWYLLWILPFAALRSSGPWILLSGLVFLGYWGLGTFQETGVWPQPGWLRLLVWGPPVAWITLQGAGGIVDRLRRPAGSEQAADSGEPPAPAKHLGDREAGPAERQVPGTKEE